MMSDRFDDGLHGPSLRSPCSHLARHRGREGALKHSSTREPTPRACVTTAVVASPVTMLANGHKAPLFQRPLTPRCICLEGTPKAVARQVTARCPRAPPDEMLATSYGINSSVLSACGPPRRLWCGCCHSPKAQVQRTREPHAETCPAGGTVRLTGAGRRGHCPVDACGRWALRAACTTSARAARAGPHPPALAVGELRGSICSRSIGCRRGSARLDCGDPRSSGRNGSRRRRPLRTAQRNQRRRADRRPAPRTRNSRRAAVHRVPTARTRRWPPRPGTACPPSG